MLIDGYGFVLNEKATYVDIAEKLKNGRPVIICWTDELRLDTKYIICG